MSIKRVWNLLTETINQFFDDKAFRLSAALAYYSVFSIAPLVIIVIGIAGFFLGQDAVRQQLQQQLTDLIGEQATTAIVSMAQARPQGSHLLATIIGIAVLLFGASGVFGELQDSLDEIWKVQPRPGLPLWRLIKSRILSFTMVLGIGFLLFVSMVVSAVLAALTGGALGDMLDMLPIPGFVLHWVNFLASFVVAILLFAMIFKVLPDAKVRWHDVWIGAIFTALLFSVGKHFLGLYLGWAAVTSAYGAAGSLVLVLLWVYYSSLILFFGAEFTQTYARARGAKILPGPYAVTVTAEAQREQGRGRKELAPQTAANQQEPKPQPAPVSSSVSATSKSPRRVLEEALAERSWKTIPKATEIIRRKPWPYLGLALGFGVATGWVVRRDLAQRNGKKVSK